jgi:hypothetical protein
MDETSLTVASTVEVGERFDYVFDLGDDWRHSCEVEAADRLRTTARRSGSCDG